MLHIVSAGTRKNESDDEIRAIHTSLYRFLVENNKITHHDFSIFGRIITYGLGLRNPAGDEVELAYIAAHQLILEFLNNCFKNDNAKFAPITGKGIFRAEQ